MHRLLYMLIVLGLISGCSSPEATYERSGTPEITIELRRASRDPVDGWRALEADPEFAYTSRLYVCPTVEISNDDLVSTGVRQEGEGLRILLKLDADAAKRFGELSKAMVGMNAISHESLAILVDGKLVAAPFISTPIYDGVIPIPGPWSKTEAQQMAQDFVSNRSDGMPNK